MRPWHRLSLLVIGVAIINAATFAMLERNLRNNVYPTDADTIIIPIFETAIGSLIVLPALVAIALMPLAAWVSRLSSKGPWWRSGLNLLILGSYAMVGLFAIAGAATWAIPKHYVVAVCYVALLVTVAALLLGDVRRLLSNNRMERTRER